MITVYDDAPEENNEYAEPQTCEGDGIRLYFRAVGEPWFESRKIKIRLSLRDNLIFWKMLIIWIRNRYKKRYILGHFITIYKSLKMRLNEYDGKISELSRIFF